MDQAEIWKLARGTAYVFPSPLSRGGIIRPVILAAGGTGAGQADLDAFEAGLNHTSYSFLTDAHDHGLDLILVGYADYSARLADLADVVVECDQRASTVRQGSKQLSVGGIGRGALAARYGLAAMEARRQIHEAGVYFSYNGTAPSQQEDNDLADIGEWPQMPVKLGMATADFTSKISLDLDTSPFDDTKIGAADPGGPLITKELGSWLLERLPS